MTITEFAQAVVADASYRESVLARARAGQLAPDIELFLLEAADARTPVSADVRPPQSRTLALIPPRETTR